MAKKDYDKIEASEQIKTEPQEIVEAQKNEQTEHREIKSVPVKKKSLFGRFMSAITPEGGYKQLASDTFKNSIVPAGRDMAYNAAQGALQAIIYNGRNNGGNFIGNVANGAVQGAQRGYRQTRGNIPYNQMGRNNNQTYVSQPRHDFTLIEHYTQGDADYVLTSMRQYISDQGYCSLADYYGLTNAEQSGVVISYTDNNFGWTDLSNARSIRAQSGYFTLQLPPLGNI